MLQSKVVGAKSGGSGSSAHNSEISKFSTCIFITAMQFLLSSMTNGSWNGVTEKQDLLVHRHEQVHPPCFSSSSSSFSSSSSCSCSVHLDVGTTTCLPLKYSVGRPEVECAPTTFLLPPPLGAAAFLTAEVERDQSTVADYKGLTIWTSRSFWPP